MMPPAGKCILFRNTLRYLAKDFSRFQGRMDKLSKHIDMAQKDVSEAHISARKIVGRFDKIEKVEIDDDDPGQDALTSDAWRA